MKQFTLLFSALALVAVVGCAAGPKTESYTDPETEALIEQIDKQNAEIDEKMIEVEAEMKEFEQKYGTE